MWFFKETEKAKVLQGRTITYLAENKLFITKEYLSQILSGTRGCSRLFSLSIISISPSYKNNHLNLH